MTDAEWNARQRERAQRYGVPFEPVSRAEIIAAARGKCGICGGRLSGPVEIDHVVPLSRGGYSTRANLRAAHADCNRRKAATRPADPAPTHLVAAAQLALWRLGIPTQYAATVPAPQCHTVLLDLDPTHMPAAVRADAVVSAAIGSASPVRLARVGSRLALQVPRPRTRVVPLRLMRSRGRRVQVGVTTFGRRLVLDLADALTAHVFIAGASGSGKSELLRAIVAGLARGNAPDALRMVLADTKRQTFVGPLARLPHLLYRVARTPDEARAAVVAVTRELERRIAATVDGDVWRADAPPWVLCVDELQDLGDASALARIARQGRAFAVHCVAATQVQRARELDTRIVAQFGARFCGRVAPSDRWTSRVVLDTDDARQLSAPGDMLARIGPRLTRVQVAYAAPGDVWWTCALADVVTAEAPPEPEPRAPDVSRIRHRLTDDVRAIIDSLRRDGRLPGVNRTAKALGVSNDAAARLLREVGS